MLNNLQCDLRLAAGFSSSAQIARVLCEAWVAAEGFCLNCDTDNLTPTARNTRARDFTCMACGHPYELKSKHGNIGRKVNDGSYTAMMERFADKSVPTFLFLGYDDAWRITRLTAVHRFLIDVTVIERRPPLRDSARRAGWVGCNILLDKIPLEGRVELVMNGCPSDKSNVRIQFAAVSKLEISGKARGGWTATTLCLLRTLNLRTFTLEDAYSLEAKLAEAYPENLHIKAKIRQQLQILRDAGLLLFEGAGRYRFLVQS